MRECPTVAIIQHESGRFHFSPCWENTHALVDVMQVAHHYFENGIAYFTRRINRCISMGTTYHHTSLCQLTNCTFSVRKRRSRAFHGTQRVRRLRLPIPQILNFVLKISEMEGHSRRSLC